MSTEITQVKAIDGEIILSQFYGGRRLGLCLQITTPIVLKRSDGFAQLTKSQVQQLVKELQNWLGETELPWKSNGQIAFENYVWNSRFNHPSRYRWDQLSLEQQQNWEEMFP